MIIIPISLVIKEGAMTQKTQSPKWFSIVAVVALVWNILGLMAFVSHIMMTPEVIAELPKAEQALYQNTPLWATIAFACAVVGGTLGSILLILKKSLANILFLISLFGVLVNDYYSFFIIDSLTVYGIASIAMPIMVLIVAIALILLTSKAQQNSWIS